MGLSPENEFEIAPATSVDLVLEKQRKIVEVDGKTHFFLNSTRRHGLYRFRERLAERLGWEALCIPHFEWEELENLEQQQKYLRDKLRIDD